MHSSKSASDNRADRANRCVDHSTEMCKDPCTGDKSRMCGGFWFVDVFQIRADAARTMEDGEMVLFWLLISVGLAYCSLGVLWGARRKGASLRVRSAEQARALLHAHPHYAREPPRYRCHLGCILLEMPAILLSTGALLQAGLLAALREL